MTLFIYFRFNDAGYYYWKLSMQCLDVVLDKGKYSVGLSNFVGNAITKTDGI